MSVFRVHYSRVVFRSVFRVHYSRYAGGLELNAQGSLSVISGLSRARYPGYIICDKREVPSSLSIVLLPRLADGLEFSI